MVRRLGPVRDLILVLELTEAAFPCFRASSQLQYCHLKLLDSSKTLGELEVTFSLLRVELVNVTFLVLALIFEIWASNVEFEDELESFFFFQL